MNKGSKYFKKPLRVCPKCGMDSGRRLVSDTIPERYFVVCETCGYRTKGYVDQTAATNEWIGKNKRPVTH